MRLLLDEMYPATIAEQLRARGHDVASVHDLAYRRIEAVALAPVDRGTGRASSEKSTTKIPLRAGTDLR